MKTIDTYMLAALPAAMMHVGTPEGAAEEAFKTAKAAIRLLCKENGHDWDVLTCKGICQRCGTPRDAKALDQHGVTETNFGKR